MNRSPVIKLFLLMLVCHIGHVFEEMWGRFWLIQAFYGMEWFLAVNWGLFCIPVFLFYFVLRGKRWAYSLSAVYSGIMILNGAWHIIATIITKKYFDGFAGGYSGIGLVFFGLPLIILLRRESATIQN